MLAATNQIRRLYLALDALANLGRVQSETPISVDTPREDKPEPKTTQKEDENGNKTT